MLHVVIHVPVEKSNKGAGEIGSCTVPPIRNVRLHPNMLGHMCDESKPAKEEGRKGNKEQQYPIIRGDKKNRENRMTNDYEPLPIHQPFK